ncbi:MAG TPA: hypothetical protein PLM56_16380 [Cyclobacteriaceae bacterium]|jgi:hypothetical protein|nr:hypothetical protein [Cytophagales bacterium]HMR56487.1 hypothetical protein [Cyclobacteriaceae bacterium]HNT50491.1 hypothetical protein [Cyclobacteriaceae bacterium]HRE68091.1 hypothetical protein [Cyclobacteriaceae bacterium]HRF35084.1 hypothetical protein [Cyclobacteriaceae bacterium]
MKEVIIKYNDSKTLELLRSLAGYLGFTISEKKDAGRKKKKGSFNALKIDTRGYRFNREEANER